MLLLIVSEQMNAKSACPFPICDRLFNHDPVNYHDPSAFKPERFLGRYPEPDPGSTIFGFGRR